MGSALVVGLFSVIGVTVAGTFINGAYKWRQAYLALRQTKDHIEVSDGERAQKNIHERRAHNSQMWAVGRGAEIDDSAIRKDVEGARAETLEGFGKIDARKYLLSSEFVDLVNVGVLSRGEGGKFQLADDSRIESEYVSPIERPLEVYNDGLDERYRDEAMAAFVDLPVLTEGNFIESVLQQHEEAEEFANRSSAKRDSAVEGEEASEAREGVAGQQVRPKDLENQKGAPAVEGAQAVPVRGLEHQTRLGAASRGAVGTDPSEKQRTSAAKGKFFRFGSRKGRSS